MIGYIEYLNLPAKVAIVLIMIFFIIQIIGELLEFKGKVVPEFAKIRKYFRRKKQERRETIEALNAVKTLLNDVNIHYSEDNISKRNSWIQWVNDRAEVYDCSILELKELVGQYKDLTDQLKANTEVTLDLYINYNRNRIIDFASKVINEETLVSREEFNRIFKVYNEYEDVLEKNGKTNGEVDVAYHIIQEAYENHMRNHSFIEDVKGY